MSRQYFADVLVDPNTADFAAYGTVTTEAMLWASDLFTPIPAFDMRVGKIYKVTAGGIVTLPAATGSMTLNARVGKLITSPTLGASGALFSPGATTNRPWLLEIFMTVRAIAVAGGAASTVIGHGRFVTQGLLTTGAAPFEILMGGTANATIDTGIANSIGCSIIWGTTAGSITPQTAFIQSLN